jgi:oxygen-dependent protoporphyrinogen oxidase
LTTTVAVVGGGITGLTAALTAMRSGSRVVLIEAAERLGGKIRTDSVAGAHVEAGADWFVTNRPEALELCRELGLEDELVPPAVGGVHVWSRGRLRPFPTGFVRGIPTSAGAVLRCDFLSWSGRLRALADLAWPRRLTGDDLSIGEFVRRRFGREVLERLVDPMLAASRSGAADDMSLAAGAPEIDSAARSHRSVMRALGGNIETDSGFVGLRGGMQQLIDALQRALGAADVRTGTQVVGLAKTGGGYALELADGEAIVADGVILAVPAFAVASLLGEVSAEAAAVLRTIDYAPAVVVGLVYDSANLAVPREASGFLVPSSDRRVLTAAAWFSAKWPHAAPPDGGTVIRCFAGDAALGLDDGDLVAAIRSELGEIAGIHVDPRAAHVVRWERALPLYTVGHLTRVAAARDALSDYPGLAIAGAGYEGSGLPACIAQGQDAARRVVGTISEADASR